VSITLFFSITRPPPSSTLFPYTTLFRSVVAGIITAEAIRTAQAQFGKGKPMTGEQVRWGIEHLNIDDKRLKELGATGLMQALKVSCMDHEGGGAVKFLQWDGKKWKVITDWIASDQSIV